MRRGVPSLSALQAFEAAARHESFSKAAVELSQTHGAVCKKVNELEAHLGITLFERVRQRLVLSAAGAEYARRIRVHLDQIRRDTLELVRQQSEVKIQLAVGVTFASQWLIPRLHDFYELNPDLQLHIMGRDQPTFFDNSSFDAAIYFAQSLWPAMPGQPLVNDDRILAVCAPALIGRRDSLSAEGISALPWIHTRDLPRAWLAWSETACSKVIEPSTSNQHYDMFIMAINAAISGLGVALLPRILIERELQSGALIQVHPHSIPNPETVYYSFPEQKRDWEPLQRFDRWLSAAVRDYRDGCRRDHTAAVEATLAPN
ncbi:DNA-binding transcriptional LysR family regulator [Paraburkholderia sp. GAS38]|uniref:LysR substrate-binding domain-containing protein n=1 Tax=Paraburkholderia sp. GAS38 TaxID=3035133 RepID=UPI003D25AEB0